MALQQNSQKQSTDKASGWLLPASIVSMLCLLVSLIVCYPLSMETDRFGSVALRLFAYLFYLLQGISFGSSFLTLLYTVNHFRQFNPLPRWLTMLINLLVLAIFLYEGIWLLQHI